MNENDIFIDDVDINNFGLYLLENHEHPLLAATRDRSTEIPNMPGAYDYGADLSPIPFVIPLGTEKENMREVQRTLRKFKSVLIDSNGMLKTFRLKFGYETDKYYNVRYSGSIPVDRLINLGSFSLPLTCYDGHSWSVAKNDEVTWGSKLITFASEYTFGHRGDGAKTFTSPGETTVTVTGANIQPIIHISGSGSNVSVRWGGKTLTLGSFTNSDWIIDLKEFEVTRNGLNAIDIIKGDWLDMHFVKGDNKITINGTGLNLTFRVEFRDRYF